MPPPDNRCSSLGTLETASGREIPVHVYMQIPALCAILQAVFKAEATMIVRAISRPIHTKLKAGQTPSQSQN